jgi:hypothetical protein
VKIAGIASDADWQIIKSGNAMCSRVPVLKNLKFSIMNIVASPWINGMGRGREAETDPY